MLGPPAGRGGRLPVDTPRGVLTPHPVGTLPRLASGRGGQETGYRQAGAGAWRTGATAPGGARPRRAVTPAAARTSPVHRGASHRPSRGPPASSALTVEASNPNRTGRAGACWRGRTLPVTSAPDGTATATTGPPGWRSSGGGV